VKTFNLEALHGVMDELLDAIEVISAGMTKMTAES
jgi:hypothetical protein